MTAFSRSRRIRFSDCDPAGIVFYPQYFVMFNDLLEEWVDAILVDGFAGYIARHRFGLPTVSLDAEFRAVSRMGERVNLELEVVRISARSFTLALRCKGLDGAVRMSFTQTLVTTSIDTHRAIPIPGELRGALSAHIGAAGPDAVRSGPIEG